MNRKYKGKILCAIILCLFLFSCPGFVFLSLEVTVSCKCNYKSKSFCEEIFSVVMMMMMHFFLHKLDECKGRE